MFDSLPKIPSSRAELETQLRRERSVNEAISEIHHGSRGGGGLGELNCGGIKPSAVAVGLFLTAGLSRSAESFGLIFRKNACGAVP